MDHFESIICTLLEAEGFWVRRSFKVNLTKEEKRLTGKHTIPRPEIDVLALKVTTGEVFAIEAKSYLDSSGVKLKHLEAEHDKPTGRYKLFTCTNYREIVFSRLKSDLQENGMISTKCRVKLGLVAGKISGKNSDLMKTYMDSRDWLFWSPEEIKNKVTHLANQGYANDPSIITAKILMR